MADVRVAVHGASGRLGRLIVEEAGVAFAGPVPRGGPVPDCDVVVDVTSAEGLAALLPGSRRDGGRSALTRHGGASPPRLVSAPQRRRHAARARRR